MPDYEFLCRSCSKQFTAHMSIQEHESQAPECPECKTATDVQRVISHFNVQTTKKSSAYR
jgi:putative FmdB family regulatory protein